MKKRVKLAILGGNRGKAFNKAMELLQDDVELTCICDLDEETIREWKGNFPDITGYTRYEDMLEAGQCDAVFIATPIELHAAHAIAAMRAGKHVLCEVTAANTIEDCWELIETVEKTGLVYMLAENYCYMRPNLTVLNMVNQGVFGDLTFAEGAYVHDCRRLRVDEQGFLTWRGEQLRNSRGNVYPTHSLGPIAQWLGINRHDKIARTSTFVSKQKSMNHYIEGRFGSDHPALQAGYWAYGDSVTTIVETESGVLVTLRFDGDSNRPHNMAGYSLQGTKAGYLSGRYEAEEPIIWIEGMSKVNEYGEASEWDQLSSHYDRFEHPKWQQNGSSALQTGHWGGDFFVIKDFAEAINKGTRPPIDVYDAVTWSSIVPLSAESVRKGGVPVEVPDFASRKR